jgi:hypothetical protein
MAFATKCLDKRECTTWLNQVIVGPFSFRICGPVTRRSCPPSAHYCTLHLQSGHSKASRVTSAAYYTAPALSVENDRSSTF